MKENRPTSNDGADEVQRLGRYLLLRLLAAGGMAEIFLARHIGIEGFRKLLVIKRIHKHLALDQRFVEMFFDEARIAARLSHPNIVQIFDLGRVSGHPFIAMEYVEGVSLHDLLVKNLERHNPPMPWPLVCFIAARACEGLAHAHALKDETGKKVDLVHRDISPHNILASFDGVPKIVDFGIARASIRIEQTQSYSRKGKLRYMSPEQTLGLPLDARSDLFSLGIVLWELLTNQRLFDAEGELAVLQQVTSGSVPDPNPPGANVPEAVIRAVHKALAREPVDRFSDAGVMGEAFEAALKESLRQPNAKQLAEYLGGIFAAERERATAETTRLLALDVTALAKEAESESLTGSAGPRKKSAGRLLTWGLGAAAALALVVVGLFGVGLLRPLGTPASSTVSPPATSVPETMTVVAPPTPPATTGRLKITSTQAAVVLLDGKRVGQGELVGPIEVAPGDHLVRGEKSGFKPMEKSVRVGAGDNLEVELSLAPAVAASGYLTFNSMPWATVFLGDRELGETPLVRIKLPVGKHKLRVLPLGKGPAKELQVEIQAGQLTLKTVNL